MFRKTLITNLLLKKNVFLNYKVPFSCSAINAEKCKNLIRHNFHEKCEEGLNHQINQEFYISYIYLYMASIFSKYDVALHGFANFFRKASLEETQHAHMLIEFLNKRGGELCLKDIKAPEKMDWSNPMCAVQCSLDLEKQVSQSLNALHQRASEHKDHHLSDFIETYFLTEQYEAIKKLGDLVTNLKRAGPGVGTILIDMELQKDINPYTMHGSSNINKSNSYEKPKKHES